MNEHLIPTLTDAISLLHAESLPCAVIGGLAVSARGQPRVTADIDMVVATDVEGMLGLLGTLPTTPFEPLFQGVDEVIERAYLPPMRHRQHRIKVDLAVGMSGFERQAVARAKPVQLAGVSVPVVTTEDLILMKTLAGRDQDQLDLQMLACTVGESVDWNYCVKVATEFRPGPCGARNCAARRNLSSLTRPNGVTSERNRPRPSLHQRNPSASGIS